MMCCTAPTASQDAHGYACELILRFACFSGWGCLPSMVGWATSSPSRQQVAAECEYGNLHLLAPDSGDISRAVILSRGFVRSCSYLPNGHQIATGLEDGNLHLGLLNQYFQGIEKKYRISFMSLNSSSYSVPSVVSSTRLFNL